ncbi:MAG: ABC transporter substrate-binding protein [Chloroflexi bacterium]|nr:ABC transporter substrate-binding protein [Chloroflexota bacterium]
MNEESSYWDRMSQKRLSRRRLMSMAARAGLGLAGATLLGCAAAPAPTPTKAPGAPPAAPTPTTRPAATPTPAATYGGQLLVTGRSTTVLDPDNQSGGRDAFNHWNMYDGLTSLNTKGEIIPGLAESWEIPDPTTIILKLRKGVKFHDGTDFNAQAVIFNFDRRANPDRIGYPKFKSKVAPDFELAKTYEALDDYTVKITLFRPSVSFLYSGLSGTTSAGAVGWMVSPAAVKKYNNDLRQASVGTGAFMFEEWKMDDKIVFKKNPSYWQKGIPYLDGITWLVIPDTTVALTMLKNKQAHMDNWMTEKEVPLVKADPDLVLGFKTMPGWISFEMNLKKSPFDKLAVRQAMAYAIDRKAISDVVFQGLVPPADAWFPPGTWPYDPSIKGYPYDMAKAKEKLKEGGYPDGFDVDITVSEAQPEYIASAEVIQEMLRKIGVRAKLQVTERAKALDMMNKGEFVAAMYGSSGAPDPTAHLMEVGHSRNDRVGNTVNKDDPLVKRLDALVDKADTTFSIEARKPIIAEFQKIQVEEVYRNLFLVYQIARFVWRKEVQGFETLPGRFASDYRTTWLKK